MWFQTGKSYMTDKTKNAVNKTTMASGLTSVVQPSAAFLNELFEDNIRESGMTRI